MVLLSVFLPSEKTNVSHSSDPDLTSVHYQLNILKRVRVKVWYVLRFAAELTVFFQAVVFVKVGFSSEVVSTGCF